MSVPAALVTGGLGLLGGLIGNSASAREAQKNRDWQERMSDTEMQRRVADLKMAGLNPMLAYTQGGASSGSGATAQQDNPFSSAVPSAQALSQAMAVKKNNEFQDAQIDRLAIQNANDTAQTQANVNFTNAQAGAIATSVALQEAQIRQADENAALMRIDQEKRRGDVKNNEATYSKILADRGYTEAQTQMILKRLPLEGAKAAADLEAARATAGNLYASAEASRASARRTTALLPGEVLGLQLGNQSTALGNTAQMYGMNELKANSDFYGSTYGHAQPYISSASGVLNTAANVAGAVTGAGALANAVAGQRL